MVLRRARGEYGGNSRGKQQDEVYITHYDAMGEKIFDDEHHHRIEVVP
jgi:hypothetical protein